MTSAESTHERPPRPREGKVRFICADDRAPTLAAVLDALRAMPIPATPAGVLIPNIRIAPDGSYMGGKYVQSGHWEIAIDWEMPDVE